MASDSFVGEFSDSLKQSFPDADPHVIPLGARVLVQLKRTANVTKSGLVIVEETKETVKWNTQVARVVALGALAYKNRETARDWPEGPWVSVGEFVRVPRWGGDRIEVPMKDGEPATFVIFQDHEIISKIVGDPLALKAYIL